MNKSELIHEIYLFDKALADYGISKEIKLHEGYYLSFGTLNRDIGNDKIRASNLVEVGKEKSLLAFYETFFHDLDTLDMYRDGNSYFEKVLNYIKRKTAYDKFELVHSSFIIKDYNSVEFHFKDSYNKIFLPQNQEQKDALEMNNKSVKFYNIIGVTNSILAATLFITAVYFFINKINIFYNPIFILALLIGFILKIVNNYISATIEKYKAIADDMEYEIGDFAKLNKRNYYKDIYQFYKDDLFFKELQKQYNINTTPTGNQIIGD
jgi:hypothetical protein|nr:MAG TPA: Protein of unknown function (DUF2663) [Caudoviricetes sp.]